MPATEKKTKRSAEKAAADRMKVMANAKRRAMLMGYRDKGPVAPVELSHALRLTLSDASYHTRQLLKYGFIELVRTEQVRGSTKSYYIATERHIVEQPEWREFDVVQKEATLAEGMEPLVDDFNRAAAAGTFGDDGDFHLWRTPFKSVDREGYEKLLDLHRRMMEESEEIVSESAERMRASGEDGISVTSASQCFVVPGFR